jgi:hypothetical protein
MLSNSDIVHSLYKQLQFVIAKSIALKDLRPLLMLLKPYGLADTIEDIGLVNNKVYLYKVYKVIKGDEEFDAFSLDSSLEEKAEPDITSLIKELCTLLRSYGLKIPLDLTHIIEVDYRSYKALLGNISIDFEISTVADVFDAKGHTTLLNKPTLSIGYKRYLTQLSNKIKRDGLGNYLYDTFIFMPYFNRSETSLGYFMYEVAPKYLDFEEDAISLDIVYGEPWHEARPTDSYYNYELIHKINFNKQKYAIIQGLQSETETLSTLTNLYGSNKSRTKQHIELMNDINRIKGLDEVAFRQEFGNRL